MNWLLQEGAELRCDGLERPLQILRGLGGGTQGQVYAVAVDGEALALKWYLPACIARDPGLAGRLRQSIGLGAPLPDAPVPGARVLEKGSWAAAVVDELVPDPGDLCVDKFRMSGFWDTPLDSILRNLGISTVFFGGVNADQCVLATLMDANFLGYDTVLVEDCSATTSPAFCMEATLYNVRQCFGFSVTSAAIRKALRD